MMNETKNEMWAAEARMWAALEAHQPPSTYAEAWARMLKERTQEAAWDAARAAEETAAAAEETAAWAARHEWMMEATREEEAAMDAAEAAWEAEAAMYAAEAAARSGG